MRKRIMAGVAILMAVPVLAIGTVSVVFAQEKKANPPKYLYGKDLQVRTGGKQDFNTDTPRIGVEFFNDEATNSLIAISEIGALAVAPARPLNADRGFKWLTGHDLSARKAGEKEFTQKTKKFGIELYRDNSSNQLFYISEVGSIAFAPIPAGLVTNKGPAWHHAGEFHVRNYEQVTFENARKIGIETHKDENSGDLIYITEVGAISTAPAPAANPDPKARVLPPKAAYGLSLRVRGANEYDFTAKTKRIGVEVFEDQNAGNMLLYVTETGYIATVPNPGKFADANAKGVTWKHAMAESIRKAGEASYEAAKRYGIEVFVDNRTGNLIFISETGSIAVLPKQ